MLSTSPPLCQSVLIINYSYRMFQYHQQELYIEDCAIKELAKRYGTPLYVYSQNTISAAFKHYQQVFSSFALLLCYAVKANSNLSILSHLAHLGAGFDIVSGGELQRLLIIGVHPQKIIFSGINKSEDEIELALKTDILCFNIESLPEIERIQKIAKRLQKKAPISFRINPNIDAKTHPYISTGLRNNKFGIPYEMAEQAYQHAKSLSHLSLIGIDCHIGSQLMDTTPLKTAADKLFILIKRLENLGICLDHVDLGGGIGIPYHQEPPPDYTSYAAHISSFFHHHPQIRLILEPGRSIIGPAGALITKVDFIKLQTHKNFIIVDTGMNDLMRPALYQSDHSILPVRKRDITPIIADVVGPICESTDKLAVDIKLQITAGDYLAIQDAGAYAASMASHYNSRSIAAEVLVAGKHHRLIRARDRFEDLIRNELPFITDTFT